VTPRIIDANINLGRWPTRRFPLDDPTRLTQALRQQGVVEAWAGAFDALLHRDLGSVNARLARECQAERTIRLVPFGSVNPAQPDWKEDLRRCVEDHRMPGIRLYPNYHGYTLEHPGLVELLDLAAQRNLVVGLCLMMEDERMMLPRLRVPPVNAKPLASLVSRIKGLRLLLLNSLSLLNGPTLQKVVQAGEVSVDLSMREGAGGLSSLISLVSRERILFGSYAPSLYMESALLKIQESDLDAPTRLAILEQNAQRLLSARTERPTSIDTQATHPRERTASP